MKYSYSFAIRTFNEERLLPRLLKSITNQKNLINYEIIILDSESTDRTKSIATSYPKVKFVTTSKNKFNFGASCNQINKLCTKDIVIFLSGHVQLLKKDFISRLDNQVYIKKIKAGYFRQLPDFSGNGASIYDELFLKHKFKTNNTCYSKKNKNKHNFSNAGSFYKKNIIDEFSFKIVTGSEDKIWANDFIGSGNKIHYLSNLQILHSHNESYNQITERVYINKIAIYGKQRKIFKFLLLFLGISLLLFIKTFKIDSFEYGLAHGKAYLRK